MQHRTALNETVPPPHPPPPPAESPRLRHADDDDDDDYNCDGDGGPDGVAVRTRRRSSRSYVDVPLDKMTKPDSFENDGGGADGDGDGDGDVAGAASAPPPSGPAPPPRSIDDYLEGAWSSSSGSGRWRLWLIFVTLGMGNMGDGTELSSIGYLLANKDFQGVVLHDDFSTDGSIVASVSLAGMIMGGLLAGAFEDALGRKSTLLGGLSSNAIACALTALAPNVAVFAALRFVVGLGIGAILSSLTALSAELSPPSRRGMFVTVVSGFWSFGMIFAACAAYATMGMEGMSWRWFLVVTSLPSLASVALVAWVVPDSPRFLALHGNYERAADVANDVAGRLGYGGAKLSAEEVRHHFSKERGTNDGDEGEGRGPTDDAAGKVAGGGRSPAPRGRSEVGTSIREAAGNISALYASSLRNRTVSLQLLWIFLEMGTGLGPFLNVICEEVGGGPYSGSALSAVGNLVGSVLGAIYLDRAGRKATVSAGMVLGSLTMLCAARVVSSGERSHPLPPLLLCIFLFAGLSSLSWNANMTLTSEMFPTKVRATGLGYVAATGRLANIGQQFISGALVERPGELLTVSGGLMMVGASTMLLLRTGDMARRPLSDSVGRGAGPGGGGGRRREYAMVSLEGGGGRGEGGGGGGGEGLPEVV